MNDTTAQTVDQILERAQALAGFGRWADAIGELRRGLAEHPDDLRLTSFLGWYEFWEGDREQGVEAAQRALAMDAREAQSLTVLLEHAIASDRPAEARGYAERQLAAYPEWSTAHLNLAWAALNEAWRANREGEADKADRAAAGQEVLAHTQRALELDPEREEVLRRAVNLMRDVNVREQAVAVLDRALSLHPTSEALLLLATELKAEDDVDETKLLLGVLAENPQQRHAARRLSENVWWRTGMVAALTPWMLAALMLIAYLAFDQGGTGSSRTERRFAGAFVLLPLVWLGVLIGFNRRALPKKYLRRVYRPVWWVWVGLAVAVIACLLMSLVSLAILVRMQPGTMERSGPYVGGLTMMIGFIAAIGLLGELLVVWARIRSEARNRLFTASDAGLGSMKRELGHQAPGLVRVALAAILALMPVIAAPIAARPEAAGGFAAVAVALGAPPLVLLLVRGARILRVRGPRPVATALIAVAGAVTILGLAAVWLFALRHAAEHDPPPTPWELEMREQQREIRERLDEMAELRDSLDGIPSAP